MSPIRLAFLLLLVASIAHAQVTVPPQFKVDCLLEAAKSQGTWISMTIDPQGRLIISADAAGLLRITLPTAGHPAQVEKLITPLRHIQGLLYAHDSLYANGRSRDGKSALFRLRYSSATDQFTNTKLLFEYPGGGDHGQHSIILGPDGFLYACNGNMTGLPISPPSPDSPHRNYAEDILLPREQDPNGHARGILAPGAYIMRFDKDGTSWQLLAAGMRNPYDITFNSFGDLFTFDADMEWDFGLPWYRPTRLLHIIPGADFGWRAGSGKWPAYYPDSLPAVCDIGLSSPTGIKFGYNSNFPPPYRNALFLFDWAYGRILAAHLQPKASSYSATWETFATGKPLNVTDLEFGPDGAMYFITGGWSSHSALYRISYTGPKIEPRPEKLSPDIAGSRNTRLQLQSALGHADPASINLAWPHLTSPDRTLRYLARLVLEHQDPSLWQSRALKDPNLSNLLALARTAKPNLSEKLFSALAAFNYEKLAPSDRLELLRIYQLSLIRLGPPTPDQRSTLLSRLDPLYPATTPEENRELCQLLIFLQSPTSATKTVALLNAEKSPAQQIAYAFALRNLKSGWTLQERKAYFLWFEQARSYHGGNSFAGYLHNARKQAIAALTDADRLALADILNQKPPTKPAPIAPPGQFIRDWTLDDFAADLANPPAKTSLASGQQVFSSAGCISCHHFKQDGGNVGPDLTGVANRFNRHDLLESILVPSKSISDIYADTTLRLKNGDLVSGRLIAETPLSISLRPNPLEDTLVEIPLSKIKTRKLSPTSPMPQGLLNNFTHQQILDLLAYLESGAL